MIQLDTQTGSDLHTYASNILSCSKQATQLTSKLLAFARKRTKAKVQIEIHSIINEVVALLMHSIDRKIEVNVDLNAGRYAIMGDGSQIQNALLNLGVNARDAMNGTGGKLLYSTKEVTLNDDFLESHPATVKSGDYIMISVTDNGSGIPLEIQKKIFEPFFTTKKEGQGTGLGLSAVYGTVEEHGGFMTLYSEPSIGTTFNIYFPIIETAESISKHETG
ncbi:MAG: PAS domain-containing sensor histidine kinase, partial [Proteobacteria bacterium]|nr:PAS domain-containing sensor histidine kinase [Pseudomonadota bacterium]